MTLFEYPKDTHECESHGAVRFGETKDREAKMRTDKHFKGKVCSFFLHAMSCQSTSPLSSQKIQEARQTNQRATELLVDNPYVLFFGFF